MEKGSVLNFILVIIVLLMMVVTSLYSLNYLDPKDYSLLVDEKIPSLINQIVSSLENKPIQPKQQACTLEAKVCPDGSTVGRVGPNCQFPACPVSISNNSITDVDLENIRLEIAKKQKVDVSQLKLNLDPISYEYEGKFATGTEGIVNTAGGARWIAQKINAQWVIFYDGNGGVPYCSETPKEIPVEMLKFCLDQNGNPQNR